MRKYDILFISPIIPLKQGLGLAMRAWMFLQALAEKYQVLLLVIPVVPQVNPDQGLREIMSLGVDIEQLSNRSLKDARTAIAFTLQLVSEHSFQAIHIFRLYMLPFVREILALPKAQYPKIILDMDDYESQTHNRLAEHSRIFNQPDPLLMQKAKQFAKMEDKYVGLCQRVYVCTDADRDELAQRFPGNHFRAIPNAVYLPRPYLAERQSPVFTFLFVGTMGYFPNEDAVLFFCREVLPQIRRVYSKPLQVIIAGVNPRKQVQDLSQDRDVHVTGFVPDLGSYYAQADAVIVPIRVGGGMRIKVLEAFSYHCPVVSTCIGAEGIDAIPEKHILIADAADKFADQCLRLLQEPMLGQFLARNAFELIATQYNMDHVQELIRQDYNDLLQS